MTSISAERNVEAQLLNTKVIHRKPGEIPYPVDYSSGRSIFDVWDTMFFRSNCKGLTLCQIDKPPTVVLDLGCGDGYWAIEAAKQWQTSAVIGFDLYTDQPDLSAFPQYHDIAHRVRWMHGNLLEGLPFPSSSVDFVRIAHIGLGVPEDEWQHVFEEVARIMKPGAAVEVIEEDPIFPCSQRPPLLPHGQPHLPPISVDATILESPPPSSHPSSSSLTLASDLSPMIEDYFDSFSSASVRSPLSAPPTPSSISSSPTVPYSIPSLFQASHLSIVDASGAPDPRDHSKLKAAWDAMLSSRFISKNISNVLPFYFSSLFTDVQIHQPFKIPLPPNSGLIASSPRELTFSQSFSSFTLSSDSTCASGAEKDTDACKEKQQPYGSTWHPMHLAKTVNTVRGCKEAIWEEYRKLYAIEMPMVARYLSSGARPAGEAALRESFDEEWSAWESDMIDRIDLRGSIFSTLGWLEPAGDKPDWWTWRSHVEKVVEDPFPLRIQNGTDLCRSIRAYVGWKQ